MPKKKTGQDKLRYEVITHEDPETGDLILPIPPQMLESLGWKEGDELQFDITEEGKIYIRKASK